MDDMLLVQEMERRKHLAADGCHDALGEALPGREGSKGRQVGLRGVEGVMR
jgi:hypothetical protein